MNKRLETHSSSETLSLGEKIGGHLQAGDILLLFGDLGAGKTTLTQGIARGLGVPKEEYVRSPSFTLINQYGGKMPVFHIDLYRIVSPEELDNLGLEEVFAGGGVAIVEWAEKLFADESLSTPLLGIEQWIEIHIKIPEKETREFLIKCPKTGPEKHPVFTLH